MTEYQKIQNLIDEIEQSLKKANTIQRGKNFWRITFGIPMLAFLIIWGNILNEIGVVFRNLEGNWYYDILFIITIILSSFTTGYILYLAYQIHSHFPKIFSAQFESIKYLNKKITEIDTNNIDNIQEILDISLQIYKIQTNMGKWRIGTHLFFFIRGISRKLKNLWILENQFLYQSLINIQSRLREELAKQQSILESSKSEIKKNIGGNSEFEQVTKLQQARLDKQIEQFKQLQRVLI